MKTQKLRRVIQLMGMGLTAAGLYYFLPATMAVIMASMLIGGAFYCGWLCPFGTLQEISNRLARKIGIRQIKIPGRIHVVMKWTRYVLALLVGLISADIIFSIITYNPEKGFSALLMAQGASYIGMAIILLFAVASLKVERFFCNYLCTEGAKYGLIGSISLFTIHRDSTCVSCKRCDQVCPMKITISSKGHMNDPQCINCFKCVDACPIDDTLTYRMRPKKHLWVYMSLVVLIVITLTLIRPAVADYLKLEEDSVLESNLSQTIVDDQNSQAASWTHASDSIVITDQSRDLGLQNEVTEDIDQGSLTDGVYTGSGRGFKGSIQVEVTVTNGYIEDISVIQHRDDRKWYNRAVSIIEDIINQQSTDVDLISGATFSSRGIRDAVKDALGLD